MYFRTISRIVIFIFICSPLKSLAQEWFTEGATWIYNNQMSMPFQAHGIRKFVVAKDTMLLNKPAKMILNSVISYNGQLSSQDTLFVYEQNEQVFMLHDGGFQLVYDLSLAEGAIFKLDFGCSDSISIVVDSVGHTEKNGNNLKVQYLSFSIPVDGSIHKVNDAVIEKIGSEIDFLFTPDCHSVDQFTYQGLRCYEDKKMSFVNEWWKYFHPDVACDSLIDESDVGVKENKLVNFNIYPNPVSDIFTISTNAYSSKLERIEIVSLGGIKMMELNALNANLVFNISNIPNGFYVVKLFDCSGCIIEKKIVKQTK